MCIPGAARMPGINDCPPARPLGVDGKPIDPEDLPHAEPAQPDNRAKLSDVGKAFDAVVGKPWDPVHHPMDTVTAVPVLKVLKVPGVAIKAFKGAREGEKAVDATRDVGKAVEAAPGRAPDARPEDLVAPSAGGTRPAVGKSEPMRRPDGPVDPTKPPPGRIDPWKETTETRPHVGEMRRRENDLYERRTNGLKNSPDVDLLKNKAEVVKAILDILNHLGK